MSAGLFAILKPTNVIVEFPKSDKLLTLSAIIDTEFANIPKISFIANKKAFETIPKAAANLPCAFLVFSLVTFL